MDWSHFIYFAIPAILLWTLGAWTAWKDKARWATLATVGGLCIFFAFILAMWQALERPPLRTMGETRLWYSFFLPLAGLIVYSRWHYKWIFSFSTVLATVFICINLLKPEIHSKTLMPALQSPWFAPHVIVYMFAYALLGATFLIAIYLLSRPRLLDRTESDESGLAVSTPIIGNLDNLVSAGVAFLTIGMLFGALWAKEAWGHYWSWDPKETWAAITWFSYLVYIHYRHLPDHRPRAALAILIVAFLLLQITWWGINYLPAAQGSSVHTYSV